MLAKYSNFSETMPQIEMYYSHQSVSQLAFMLTCCGPDSPAEHFQMERKGVVLLNHQIAEVPVGVNGR